MEGRESTWINTASIDVGVGGEGSLDVLNGGSVSAQTGRIGREAGAVGTATVDGAGVNWSNSGNLYVGEASTGRRVQKFTIRP